MRRWRRRLLWAAVLLALALLAIPAWVAQAGRGVRSSLARGASRLESLAVAALAAALAASKPPSEAGPPTRS